MANERPATPLEFTGLYNMPGEGLVAEFRRAGETMLYDRQGLQYRIVQLKRAGIDTTVEETALAQINAIGTPHVL